VATDKRDDGDYFNSQMKGIWEHIRQALGVLNYRKG